MGIDAGKSEGYHRGIGSVVYIEEAVIDPRYRLPVPSKDVGIHNRAACGHQCGRLVAECGSMEKRYLRHLFLICCQGRLGARYL